MSEDHDQLRSAIIQLKRELEKKTTQLFALRFKNIVKTDAYVDIEFAMFSPVDWSISYSIDVNYNIANYLPDCDDTTGATGAAETADTRQRVSFGFYKGKHFIKLQNDEHQRFGLYRNSKKELRLINKDYDTDLDLDEQSELINRYSRNTNIPEYIAVRFFLFVIVNRWTDEGIFYHFTRV
jgi:hypothetical protein